MNKVGLGTSRLQALLESAQLLHSSLDLDHLLRHLLRTVMGRLLATKGLIAVRRGGRMRLALVRGMSRLTAGEDFDESAARAAGVESLFPIGIADSPTGVLGLGKILREMTSQEEEFLKALLGIAAGGVANASAHAKARDLNLDLQRRVQDLRTLLDLVQSLTSTVDANEVAQLLALSLAGRWAVGRYAILAEKPNQPEVRRQRGLQLPSLQIMADSMEGVEGGIRVSDLPRGALREQLESKKGEIVWPLRSGEGLIGAVALGARPGGMSFESSDLEFGAGLVAQAMVAFENCWHFSETLDKKRIEQEIELAASIQQELFPKSLPQLDSLKMAAASRPARQVGGDYYDVLPIRADDPSGRYLICVADVSGKGVPASLLMSSIQATLRALLAEDTALVDLVRRTSELLYATTPANRYATAFLLKIDPATGEVEYVNAGHNDGLLLRRDGSHQALKSTGPPLGLIPNLPFAFQTARLEKGDLLALYSDGVVEAQNSADEDYGEERFLQALHEAESEPLEVIVEATYRSIDAFVGSHPQHDDITLMLLRRV